MVDLKKNVHLQLLIEEIIISDEIKDFTEENRIDDFMWVIFSNWRNNQLGWEVQVSLQKIIQKAASNPWCVNNESTF